MNSRRYLLIALLFLGCKSRAYNENMNQSGLTAVGPRAGSSAKCVEVPSELKDIFNASDDKFLSVVLDKGDCPVDTAAISIKLKNGGCSISGKKDADNIGAILGRVVVSERGLYKPGVAAPGLDPRFVDIWDCGGNNSIRQKVYIAGPGSGSAAFHVIAFDTKSEGFNFYSSNGGTTPANFFFHGNSYKQADEAKTGFRISGKFDHHPCTQCHVNGGLLMKELRLPWVNWHAIDRQVSFLGDIETFKNIDGGKGSSANGIPPRDVVFAEFLEQDVEKSAFLVNQRRVKDIETKVQVFRPQASSTKSSSTLRGMLKPLFCYTEFNLATSHREGVGSGKRQVPVDLYINRLLMPERRGSESALNVKGVLQQTAVKFKRNPDPKFVPTRLDMSSFFDDFDLAPNLTPSKLTSTEPLASFPVAVLDLASWNKALDSFSVSLPAAIDATNTPAARDGDFPMLIPSRSFVDDDYIAQLVRADLIDEKLALDILLTDFQNPLFSKMRCSLLKSIPADVTVGSLVPTGEKKFKDLVKEEVLEAVKGSSLPGAKQLFDRISDSDSLSKGAKAVIGFAGACRSAFESATVDDLKKYYRLTKSRRQSMMTTAFLERDSVSGAAFPEERKDIVGDEFLGAVEGFIRKQIVPVDKAPSNEKLKLDTNCKVALEE